MPQDLALDDQYLLLDLIQDESLSVLLHSDRLLTGWAVEPLFSGTAYRQMRAVGPHLVALPQDSASLANILPRLVNEPLGIVFQPREGMAWESLVEHCRQHLWAEAPDGRRALCRWYDPRGLRALLMGLSPTQREALTAPFASLTWHSGHGWYQWSRPGTPLSGHEPPVTWALDHDVLERVAQERQWDQVLVLVERYAGHLPVPLDKAVAKVFDLLSAARRFGYVTASQQERWLRQYLRLGEFWLVSETEAWLTTDVPLEQRLCRLEAQPLPGVKP
ncbi:DUF4123 domain-containing protein [Pseudomonas vanderleydeniana]|uniref:DUF4123 domain-containing protein n=1 Tax=Pseudomonas vanderleydeniana TaxID=2745495 RepID=A0A9E6PPV8_9PSED|nr:DUF4123 domain-containing protein [Pseudomonas vanderleydeniana]QXI30590.1 DUF4123 domain-containing protein [Pseudomonas vanderleydeniana]